MGLSARQDLLARSLLAVVAKVGPFSKDPGSEGAGYVPASQNAGARFGFRCEGCVFFRAPKACMVVKGVVDRAGVCRLYVIPQEKLGKPPVAGDGKPG